MNHFIAQTVALACHANAFLRGVWDGHFYPDNSTCKFCEQVRFVTVRRNVFGFLRPQEVAATPDAWFRHLKSHGVIGLRLGRSLPRFLGLFPAAAANVAIGDEAWSLEAMVPGSASQFWSGRWDIGNREAPDQRIWRVTYGCVSRVRLGQPATLAAATGELRGAIQEARAFAAAISADGFCRSFDQALDTLDSGGANRHGYHPDLFPGGYLSPEAATVLDACQTAWVFGGMGSWNDMGFNGEFQAAYLHATTRLHDAIRTAIEAATREPVTVF